MSKWDRVEWRRGAILSLPDPEDWERGLGLVLGRMVRGGPFWGEALEVEVRFGFLRMSWDRIQSVISTAKV